MDLLMAVGLVIYIGVVIVILIRFIDNRVTEIINLNNELKADIHNQQLPDMQEYYKSTKPRPPYITVKVHGKINTGDYCIWAGSDGVKAVETISEAKKANCQAGQDITTVKARLYFDTLRLYNDGK